VFKPIVVASLLMLSAGCGASPVVGESTVARPYDGPMRVEQQFADDADVLERSGAAGLALECNGKPGDGGGGNYDTGPETVESDAETAFTSWAEESGIQVMPRKGYVIERDDGDRVLFSYDVDGATKIAAIAADGLGGDETGWGVESWASCDPAELPPAVTDELGIAVWADSDGGRVPVSTVTHYQGPEHCDWQDITFLTMGEFDVGEQYLSDRDGELAELLTTSFDGQATLPRNAVDTGYEYRDWHLWLVPDKSAAYLASVEDPARVERWPAAREWVACA
jgi:hypothetical protein